MVLIDEHGKSILRIFTVCEYKIVLKNPKDREVKISLSLMGNGYLVGVHSDSGDLVVTANHLFLCNSSVGDLASKGVLDKLDQANENDLSVDNVVALKDGKIGKIFAYTHDGSVVSDIKTIFNTPPLKLLGDPDGALLRATIPDGIFHYHLPLMEDKIFDEIFFKESVIGKEVVARGFLLYNGVWFLRYRNALIEWTRPNIFQINELLDQGLSGGPILYLYEGRWYAIGVVSHGPTQQSARNFDMSWITIIKKSFLNNKNKK